MWLRNIRKIIKIFNFSVNIENVNENDELLFYFYWIGKKFKCLNIMYYFGCGEREFFYIL